MLPTLLAAAGDTTVKEDLLKGRKVGDTTYKVHLDGYNLLPALKGEGAVAAQGVHLLDRRRQRRGPALRQLEGHLPAAGRPRPAGLAGAVRRAARAHADQSAHGSVRAAPHDIGMDYERWFAEHMFMIAPAGGLRRAVAAELPRVPAAPEARQLQPRPRDGSGDRATTAEAVTVALIGQTSRCDRAAPVANGCGPCRFSLRSVTHMNSTCELAHQSRSIEVTHEDHRNHTEIVISPPRLSPPSALRKTVARAADPLPSWNDGTAKQAIVDFVEKVTKEGSPDFVPPAERIATFDNDGTLWAEQPMYFQLLLRARPREGARAPASGMEDQGTVRLAAQGRRERRARRRRTCHRADRHGHARRHDHRGVRDRS